MKLSGFPPVEGATGMNEWLPTSSNSKTFYKYWYNVCKAKKTRTVCCNIVYKVCFLLARVLFVFCTIEMFTLCSAVTFWLHCINVSCSWLFYCWLRPHRKSLENTRIKQSSAHVKSSGQGSGGAWRHRSAEWVQYARQRQRPRKAGFNIDWSV